MSGHGDGVFAVASDVGLPGCTAQGINWFGPLGRFTLGVLPLVEFANPDDAVVGQKQQVDDGHTVETA